MASLKSRSGENETIGQHVVLQEYAPLTRAVLQRLP
jgi:hypothetical protein